VPRKSCLLTVGVIDGYENRPRQRRLANSDNG
jgi:hypothetical protein